MKLYATMDDVLDRFDDFLKYQYFLGHEEKPKVLDNQMDDEDHQKKTKEKRVWIYYDFL